jgi:hypothetical protein
MVVSTPELMSWETSDWCISGSEKGFVNTGVMGVTSALIVVTAGILAGPIFQKLAPGVAGVKDPEGVSVPFSAGGFGNLKLSDGENGRTLIGPFRDD